MEFMNTVNQAGTPNNPELLPGQLAVHGFCDETVPVSPDERMTSQGVTGWKNTLWSAVNPSHVQEQLRASSLSDLTLKDGASLSIAGALPQANLVDAAERLRVMWLGDDELMGEAAEDSHEYNANRLGMPELDLFVGKASLTKVGVKVRRLALSTNQQSEKPSDPPQWTDEVSVLIGYHKGRYSAWQSLSAQTCSEWVYGTRVLMRRNVISSSYYGGVDYGGHLSASRWCHNQAEAIGLVTLASKLISEPAVDASN